jgi:hypothetical protein
MLPHRTLQEKVFIALPTADTHERAKEIGVEALVAHKRAAAMAQASQETRQKRLVKRAARFLERAWGQRCVRDCIRGGV